MKQCGFSMTGSLHEATNSRAMDRFIAIRREDLEDVDECLRTIFTVGKETEVAKRKSHVQKQTVLAWPPGRLPSCPPDFDFEEANQ